MSATRAPGPAEIRRALAECMTLGDVDDAMGWPQGTARRRRWRAPERGGLPPSDAELGGVAIWFRATIEGWRANPPRRAVPAPRPPEPASEPEPAQPEITVPENSEEAETPQPETPQPETLQPSDEPEPVADSGADSESGADCGAVAAARVVTSGFELELDQQVLVEVRGRWLLARVLHRARNTVVVGYSLSSGPLGERQQRISVAHLRVPPG